MNKVTTKKDLYSFIHSKIHAVISTCDTSNQPEAALIGFGETENLEIIFGTYTTTRKYKNILENNKVALVIGWDDDSCTVQYEGIASEINREVWDRYVNMYHEKVPRAKKFRDFPDQTYFKVKPMWIRFSDLSSDEEYVVEFLGKDL